jgi:predicted transcriptional regulator
MKHERKYAFRICDEAIFSQIVGMTKTQMTYWNIMQKLFETQSQLSIKDVQMKIKRARQTIGKLFDFFEESGLITIKSEGREKIAELIQQIGEATLTKNVALSLADLRTEYQKWLRKDPTIRHLLKLIDPFTGEDVSKEMADGRFKFVVDLQPVRIKEIAKATPQQNEQSTQKLEEFERVAEIIKPSGFISVKIS